VAQPKTNLGDSAQFGSAPDADPTFFLADPTVVPHHPTLISRDPTVIPRHPTLGTAIRIGLHRDADTAATRRENRRKAGVSA
jgi:hypothetical protein